MVDCGGWIFQDLLERLQRNNELLDGEKQDMAKYTDVSPLYLLTYWRTVGLVLYRLRVYGQLWKFWGWGIWGLRVGVGDWKL